MDVLRDGPRDAGWTMILAHGAGAPMDAAPMTALTLGLTGKGIEVVRFEFPYMRARRTTGKRRGPDQAPVLMKTWREVIGNFGGRRPVIGGRSMGGRIASMIADEVGVAGLVCFGYPFHPPGKPERLRTAHLADLRTPTLIVQGTRDPFGKPEEVEGYDLSAAIRLAWIEDGDHSFTPRKRSGRTAAQNLHAAVEAAAEFIGGLKRD